MALATMFSTTVRHAGRSRPFTQGGPRAFPRFLSQNSSRCAARRMTGERPRLRSPMLMSARGESTKAPSQAEDPPKWQIPQLRKAGEEDPRSVPAPQQNERGEVPAYELTFTCKPCKTRSAHRISKHGYHNGTVLITCPNCKNRHVISDHLKIFNDTSKSFEQILRQKQEQLKIGVLDPEGDFEMWDDGTQTAREKGGTGTPISGQQTSS